MRRHVGISPGGPEPIEGRGRTGRKRLLWQLYPSYLLVIVLSLLVVTLYASDATRRFFREQMKRDLVSRALILAHDQTKGLLPLDAAGLDAFCKQMGKLELGTRLTVIQPDGWVLGDTDTNPKTMENHAGRPEVQAALKGDVGYAIRESPTLHRVTLMYVAVAAQDPHGRRLVLRTAMPLSDIDHEVFGLQVQIALAGVLIAIVAAVVCLIVSGRIARPIEEMKRGVERMGAGELGHRLYVPASEEIGSLAEVINEMAAQLEDRIRLITAQRNEQEAVFASMVEGVLAVDMHERVLRMNQAAGTLLGAQPAEAQGKTIQEVVRNPELQKFIAQTLANGNNPTEGEVLLREEGERPFGTSSGPMIASEGRWLQAHGATLHDAAGRQLGAVVVLNDTTRVRQLENFRRDFVANVSHELRTPITAIKGFVETLLDGAMREPQSAEKFLGIIARQADRLNAIINDLLLLSKLEQQGEKGRIATEPAGIRGVLDAAIELCAFKAEGKHIAIEVRCPQGLRAKVNVPLLEQALVNLVDNAVKYSEPGKPVVLEATSDADGALVIRVRDEGPGIEREHLPRIFERFYRVDKGRSREMGGTGLGLSIVKHIAQAHGGSVAVESQPGKGSVFTITLPPG